MLLAGATVAASDAPLQNDGGAKAGLTPLSVLVDQPYAHDHTFNQGNWRHFLSNSVGAGQFHGRKAVRLDNGHIVVAGLVPQFGTYTNPANGMWNIGLVRYDANGNDVGWGNGSPHHVMPHVVAYPNLPDPHYADIKDMKVFGDHIYVLADRWIQNTPGTNNRLDGYVVVFRTDGTFVSFHGALNFSPEHNETGAAMAFFQPNGFPTPPAQLYIVGTTIGTAGRHVASLTRMVRNSNGTLSRDTTFRPHASFPGLVDFEVPDGYCVAGSRPCHTVANDLAITIQGFGTNARPRIYIGGAVRREVPNNWAFLAIRVNAAGDLDTSLCTNTNCHGYAMITGLGGARRAEVYSIVPRSVDPIVGQDEILLVGDIEQLDTGPHRGAGVGVVKLDNRGDRISSFGVNGTRIFGGCSSSNAICSISQSSDHPRAAVRANGQLAIAGWSGIDPGWVSPNPMPGPHVKRPFFALVDATTGTVREDRLFPSLSSYYGFGEALDIRDGGNGTFLLAGYGGPPTGKIEFITTRVRGDRIFGNGFQQ